MDENGGIRYHGVTLSKQQPARLCLKINAIFDFKTSEVSTFVPVQP
jgi:hypothetical protein